MSGLRIPIPFGTVTNCVPGVAFGPMLLRLAVDAAPRLLVPAGAPDEADLVVVNYDAESLFYCGYQRDDRHRVEFREGTQEKCGGVKSHRPASKAQHFIEDAQNFGTSIQEQVQSEGR